MAEVAPLAGRAIGAGLWTVGTRLTAKVIDLGLLLCLARFLRPEEFGLVATAMAVVLVVEALFELPMAAALIRAPVLTPGLLHTAFTLGLLRGGAVAALLAALSIPLAALDGEPRLRPLLCVLTLAPVLRGLVSPRMIAYARALDFRPDAALELAGKTVALVLSVAIAATTGSHWAIAAATVGAPLTTTLLSHAVAPLRPRLTLAHWPYFSDLVGWNFLAQAGAALNWQIDRQILPRLTTSAAFGQYAMGKQIAEIPVQALIQPLFRPAMTALAGAHAQRRSRYLQLSHAVALAMVPVMGATLLWPDVLVRAALGPAWAPAAQWLRCIGAVTLLGLPGLLVGPLAMTLDRTRWVALRTLVELAVRLPLVGGGALAFGIPGAIAGSAIATAAGTWTALRIVRRLLDVGPARQVASLWRPLLAMVPAGALLLGARPLVLEAADTLGLVLRALPVGIAYLLVYATGVFLGWRLAGRPAGLERYLADAARRRFPGAAPRSHPSTQPDTATEGHVEPTR